MLMLPVTTIHHIVKGHHNYHQSLKQLYYRSQHSVAGVFRIKTPIWQYSKSLHKLQKMCS